MKFRSAWLKEHLETDQPLEAIVERLSMLGLEVEGVENKAEALGAVHHRPRHRGEAASQRRPPPRLPRRDGKGEVEQVVCGAPNARTGMIGVFAPAGVHVPGTGLDLKKGVIRGSHRTACSAPSGRWACPTITRGSSTCRRTRRWARGSSTTPAWTIR